jgi:hypothetical protein
LWGVRNGPGSIFRLIFNGTIWTPDTANSWVAGKLLFYPGGGTASPDSEGITFAGGSSGGLYVSVERDNNNSGVSRNSVLRFDPAAAGPNLTATHEWNLTADLPPTGPNLGAEAITWISDAYLTSSNFFDENKNHAYNPAEYPNHGTGLFFVGLEANGNIYAYALDHSGNGAFNRIATVTTGLAGVMDLQLDNLLSDLWAICDDTCQGHSVVLRIDGTGKFVVTAAFERPAGMPNFNNEGFAITPASECVANRRPVFWADDTEDNGHAIRSGTLSCSKIVDVSDAIAPKASPTVSPASNGAGWNTSDVTVTWHWSDNPGGSGIDNANCTISTPSSGEGALPLNATCKDVAGNTGTATFTVKVDKTNPAITASAKKADNTAYTFGIWSNQTVTVHYTCNDSGSLIASCSADQVFSADGATSTSGTAVDNAGRSAGSGFLLVRIDKTLPSLSITSPANPVYTNTVQLPIDWTASDAGSGIASQSATLDGSAVTKGQVIDLFLLALGSHTAAVNITDNAGNTTSASASFSVGATPASIGDSIDRLLAMGAIANAGIANSLKTKLDGNPNHWNAFLNELDAQLGKKVNQQAYDLLKAATLYLIAHP